MQLARPRRGVGRIAGHEIRRRAKAGDQNGANEHEFKTGKERYALLLDKKLNHPR
jgi:hypothetical protein